MLFWQFGFRLHLKIYGDLQDFFLRVDRLKKRKLPAIYHTGFVHGKTAEEMQSWNDFFLICKEDDFCVKKLGKYFFLPDKNSEKNGK